MKARVSLGNLVKKFVCIINQTHGTITTPRPMSERTVYDQAFHYIYHGNPCLSDILEDKISQEQITNYFLFSLVSFCFSITWDGIQGFRYARQSTTELHPYF